MPERLDDLIGDDNAVRLIGAFVDSLDLKAPGFARIETKGTGRRCRRRSTTRLSCQQQLRNNEHRLSLQCWTRYAGQVKATHVVSGRPASSSYRRLTNDSVEGVNRY